MQGIELDGAHSQHHDSLTVTHFSTEPTCPRFLLDEYRQRFIGKFDETSGGGGHYQREAHPKATVAAMITYLDESIGKVVDKIDQLGLAGQTLIMFTSDNGPHSAGGNHPDHFDSNGSLRGGKRDLYEGGIRVPLIAYWPGTIAAGSTSDLICAFWDFPSTACDLASLAPPKASDGLSIAPTLKNSGEQKRHDHLYWEFYEQGGKQAVRAGKWKAIRLNVGKHPNGPLELYDLNADIGERNNLASQHPDIVQRMANIMAQEHTPSEMISFASGKSKKKKANR